MRKSKINKSVGNSDKLNNLKMMRLQLVAMNTKRNYKQNNNMEDKA